MASTVRQLVAHVARQRAMPTLAINTCQRSSFHSTQQILRDGPDEYNHTKKKNFAENMSKQFIGHVKKQRTQTKAFAEPSRFVVIDSLPPTATTEDVYKLAREAFPDGDKQIMESEFLLLLLLLHSSIKTNRYIYSCILP